MGPFRHIRYEKDGRIARVILNRPRFRNAQSRLMLEEVDRALDAAADDDEVRVIILS
jgi:enoyl-CoA hydratase/carnithine racemase